MTIKLVYTEETTSTEFPKVELVVEFDSDATHHSIQKGFYEFLSYAYGYKIKPTEDLFE